jgi:hypothetical protein
MPSSMNQSNHAVLRIRKRKGDHRLPNAAVRPKDWLPSFPVIQAAPTGNGMP